MFVRTHRPARRASLAALALVAGLLASAAGHAQGEIGGVGILMPRDGVIDIVGPAGAEIEALMVEPHDKVRQGDRLMRLSNYRILEAEVELAEQQLAALRDSAAARLRLQALAVETATLSLAQAKRSLENYEGLGSNAISSAELAARRHAVEEAGLALTVAKVERERLEKEIAHEQESARLRRDQATADLARGVVVAPRDGTVLDVLKRVGETLGGGPAIKLGDVATMYAVSDIYEGDLLRIAPGMKATVSSESLAQTFTGEVDWVGRMIDSDKRLAKVGIRLDDASLASRLVGMQVRVAIQPDGTAE